MNIFVAIKKAINTNLNKPLNVTLDEIQTSVDKVRKSSFNVKTVVGVPHNATYSSQVINDSDSPIFSVEGCGRILKILPICNYNANSRVGTALLTVDGKTLLNNKIQFSHPASDLSGFVIVNDTYYPTNVSVTTTAFGSSDSFYFGYSNILREDVSTFDTHTSGIITPIGVPFKNGFDIKLTQTISTDTNKAGVIVVYELYE